MSGTGLTAVTWAAPTVANVWHEFDLSIVNTNTSPSDVTITLTARSDANSETARVWFDGLFADPWSGSVRHHGFQWLAQTALLPDSRITLTEAAALALPVAVNHVAQTITVTGPVTRRQVFEACMADLAQTANQGRAVHIASTTGDNFETSYTVTTSGAGEVIGEGPPGGPPPGGGRLVTISAPALISGSRVQLFNMNTNTELFNGVLPTTGLSFVVTWTTNHNIRLRAQLAGRLAMETMGVLTDNGLTYMNIQADDTVHLSNGIDGAIVTEFVADIPNSLININDPDGVTSVPRLYAWVQWYQTTAVGIASSFFGAITAINATNYVIDQALANIQLNNTRTTPVRIAGGYLARKDGSTLIAPLSGSIQMDPGRAYLGGMVGLEGLARESTVQALLALSLD
ncbi:MAG: hypothetical protein DDT31_00299 [Syntrophomonadaceae bacterium]|nr:hypothetical protein [Bacillota bacterium]